MTVVRTTPMGTFRVRCRIENPVDRHRVVELATLLVATGGECTWAPAAVLEAVGIAREKRREAFPGDLRLLGARPLEALNLAVDAARPRLVARGPRPAAVCR